MLVTVEWYTAGGDLLGSARAPSLESQFIDQVPGLAMADDGAVFAVVALEDRVEVIELRRLPHRIVDFADAA